MPPGNEGRSWVMPNRSRPKPPLMVQSVGEPLPLAMNPKLVPAPGSSVPLYERLSAT
jgi:hypothetical protein